MNNLKEKKAFDHDFVDYRPLLENEDMYAYSQCMQLSLQCGLIGHLRADFGSNGNEFYSSWWDFDKSEKTDGFVEELHEVIGTLREEGDILHNRWAMMKYCYSHPESKIANSDTSYGVRLDTENYTYILRLDPTKGNYNLYCYCYRQDYLNNRIKSAAEGVRFIDSSYRPKFTLVDGGKIIVTHKDGRKDTRTAYRIDDYHCDIGGEIYHICQYGEMLERAGATVAPAEEKYRKYIR